MHYHPLTISMHFAKQQYTQFRNTLWWNRQNLVLFPRITALQLEDKSKLENMGEIPADFMHMVLDVKTELSPVFLRAAMNHTAAWPSSQSVNLDLRRFLLYEPHFSQDARMNASRNNSATFITSQLRFCQHHKETPPYRAETFPGCLHILRKTFCPFLLFVETKNPVLIGKKSKQRHLWGKLNSPALSIILQELQFVIGIRSFHNIYQTKSCTEDLSTFFEHMSRILQTYREENENTEVVTILGCLATFTFTQTFH